MEQLFLEEGGRPIYLDDLRLLQENINTLGSMYSAFAKQHDKDNVLIYGGRMEYMQVPMPMGPTMHYGVGLEIQPGCAVVNGRFVHWGYDMMILATEEYLDSYVVDGKLKNGIKLALIVKELSSEEGEQIEYEDGVVRPMLSATDVRFMEVTTNIDETDEDGNPLYPLVLEYNDQCVGNRKVFVGDDYRDLIIGDIEPRLQNVEAASVSDSFVINNIAAILDSQKGTYRCPVRNENGDVVGVTEFYYSNDKSFVVETLTTNLNVDNVAGTGYDPQASISYVRKLNLSVTGDKTTGGAAWERNTWTGWERADADVLKLIRDNYNALVKQLDEKANISRVEQIEEITNNAATKQYVEKRDAETLTSAKQYANSLVLASEGALIGEIKMWAGQSVPEGYLLCNGQEVSVAEYRELHDAIGDAFNNGYDPQGNKWGNPTAGSFRVPDLRSRFIVGYDPQGTDYNSVAKVGGKSSVKLNESEMPTHSHSIWHTHNFNHNHYFTSIVRTDDIDRGTNKSLFSIDNESVQETTGAWGKNVNEKVFCDGPTDNDYNVVNSGNTGGNQPHENRPPYYTLMFIIRAKSASKMVPDTPVPEEPEEEEETTPQGEAEPQAEGIAAE